jgi:hypothetical protein
MTWDSQSVAVDALARDMALRKFGLPLCLHIPIAAKDRSAIATYVGTIESGVGNPATPQALVVHPYEPFPADERLSIWRMPEAAILHSKRQVWVHVDYTRYREAFRSSFPATDLSDLVVDHVMNRRVARLKGFSFVRLVAISRTSNSSSGGLTERWGADFHGAGC